MISNTDPFPLEQRDVSVLAPYFAGRRVAVTGASGLIGSYAVKILRSVGAEVRAIVRKRPSNAYTRMAQEIIVADLMSPRGVLAGAFDRCSAVVSCAGITGGVNLPSKDPVSYVGPASVMVMNTLHEAYVARIERIGWLSSTTVYPPLDKPAVEDDANLSRFSNPLYPLYRGIGESKRFLERLFAYYHDTTGIGVGIVRPAGAYGRFDNFDEATSHVLPGLVSRALRLEQGQPFEVWGDGEDVRDFVHAQDVARGLLYAMAKSPDATPINVASGVGVTTKTLARVVLDAAGMPTREIQTSPGKPSALRKRLVDVSTANEVLGFKPQISLAEGVKDVVEWRRAQAQEGATS